MKKIIIPLLIICFLNTFLAFGQDLKTELIAEANILTGAPTPAGTKIIYPITGGTITGKINGKFLPIGADFGTLVSPTNFKLNVKEVIQTVDNETIYVTYQGYVHADEDTFNLIVTGNVKNLSPDKYYFRVNPIFETTSKKYDWLNHTITIGVGTITETGVSYKIYAIK